MSLPPTQYKFTPSKFLTHFMNIDIETVLGACDLHRFNRNYNFVQIIFKVGWLVVLRINVDLAIFQPYLDLEAGDNQSLKIQVARPGIEPRSSCSASQELNHSATTALIPKAFHSDDQGGPCLNLLRADRVLILVLSDCKSGLFQPFDLSSCTDCA